MEGPKNVTGRVLSRIYFAAVFLIAVFISAQVSGVTQTLYKGGFAFDQNGNLLISCQVGNCGGGSGGTINQGAPNISAEAWPVYTVNSTPIPGTTPIPYPTDGSGNQFVDVVNAAIPTPGATASAGIAATAAPPVQAYVTCYAPAAGSGTFSTPSAGNVNMQPCTYGDNNFSQGAYNTVIAQNSNSFTYAFDGTNWKGAQCVDAPTNAGCVLIDRKISISAKLSAVVTTCTDLTANATYLGSVTFASTAAQTGTLTLYNDNAGCSAADAVFSIATAAACTSATSCNIPVDVYASSALSYEWTTAAEAGVVYANYQH